MKSQVKWVGDDRYVGLTESNNSIVMDTSSDNKSAGSPMEMILMGIGGCSSVNVVNILQKARQDIQNCHVDIQAERANATPAVFTKIHLNFVVKGKHIKEAQVKRAVELSADKYCSVVMMLKHSVEITHSFEIHEA